MEDTLKRYYAEGKISEKVFYNVLDILNHLEDENKPSSIRQENKNIVLEFIHPNMAYEEITIFKDSAQYFRTFNKKEENAEIFQKRIMRTPRGFTRRDLFFLNKEMEFFRIELANKTR